MRILILIFLISINSSARVKRSLYEFGIGGFYSVLPDYPAASDFQERYIALPFFRYRGDVFRSDDEGTRAIFSDQSKLKLELSFGGSFPANSDGNKAREGMDDLDWTFEFGPRLVYEFYKDETGRVRLQLPFRVAYVTDFSYLNYQGHRWGPEFLYEYIFDKNWELNYWATFNFIDEGLSDYFFEVKEKDARRSRREYNASGGFLGIDHAIGLLYRTPRIRTFGGFIYSDYRDAMVEDSPLFKNAENTIFFIGATYIFEKSDQLEK